MKEINIREKEGLIETIERLLSADKTVEIKNNSKKGIICVGVSEKRKIEWSEK